MNADTIMTFALGLLLGVGLVMLLTSRQTRLLKRNLKKDAEISIKERTLELNEKLAKQELDIQTRESQIEQKIKASSKLEKELENKAENFNAKENELLKEQKSLDEAKYNAKKLERFYRLKLHQITQMSQKEARELLLQATEKDCEAEIQSIRREKLGHS